MTKKNNINLIIGLALFLLLKLVYTQMNVDDLSFLLSPTNQLVSIFNSSKSNYIENSGYFHADLNILVEKSCAGFNFLILCFIITYVVCIMHIENNKAKLLIIPISLLSSYFLTIFVNTSRISIAIFLNKTNLDISSSSWLHQVQGTFIYLFFLLLFYVILKHFFTKYAKKDEKLA